jgi:superoxide dismutase, Fe-Mn family
MPQFELPDLPYAEDALAPAIGPDTLNTHHKKHHAGYVKKTNDALAKNGWNLSRIEDVVIRAREDKALFNQAAQVWNHTFYWNSMAPAGTVAMDGALTEALERTFGDVADFKKTFQEKGEKHFGSGYLWLVADKAGAITLIEGHDADTPLLREGVTPLLGCDLWEHAYYLDRKNDRAAYLKAFLGELANWRFASSQLAAARGEGTAWEHPRAKQNATA